MRQATDRFRIPREMLAFISNATASSICVVVPTSTWGVFMISQLVSTGICPAEAGMTTFLKTLPFLFYPLLALLCGLLYAAGVLPRFGPMKKAYADLRRREETQAVQEDGEQQAKGSSALNFILPVALITAITIATGEILYGTLACLVFCAVLYLPQKLMSPGKYLDTILSGFKDMVGVLFIVTSAFILRDINSLLGMPEYVIGAAKTAMSPQLLPAAAFLIVTALGVAAGNFWGICAIAFPVIIPIAQALNGNLLLTAAAIISATAAASHICFYGSESTLACSAAQIDNVRYAQTAIPLLMVPFILSALFFLVAGFLFG
jgi:Na+/H+ antiporter NhaC